MTQGTAAHFAQRHVEEIINGRRLDQPNPPIQSAMARPISSGESSWT